MQWDMIKSIHFIGIGGIGMSALAQICHHKGMQVRGSDEGKNHQVSHLLAQGIHVHCGHDASYLDPSVQVVVISSAITEDNPEYRAAEQLGIPVIHRSECLRYLFNDHDILAVAGSHGKTTTTALLGQCLRDAGMDLSVVVGGIMNNTNTNFVCGHEKTAVIEADESDQSHLRFDRISYGVITNIDHDHCWDQLLLSFCSFVRLAQQRIMMNFDDKGCQAVFKKLSPQDREKTWLYGTHSACHIQLLSYKHTSEGILFSCKTPEGVWSDVPLKLWGHHNILNTLSVIGIALSLGVSKEAIYRGLSRFSGVGRRMTQVGFYKKIPVMDDYAHHPTAIKSVLKALVNGGYSRILCLFQPHRYTRLRDTMDELSNAFTRAASCIVLPVYGAGEAFIAGATSADLAKKISAFQECHLVDQDQDICRDFIHALTDKKSFDVIIFFGAGDVTDWAHALVK